MRALFSVIFVSFLAISCKNNELQTVTIANKYSIKLASDLSKTEELNADASLQYQNPYREMYIIVIHEPKKDILPFLGPDANPDTLLDEYTRITKNDIGQKMTKTKFSDMKSVQINGCKANTFSATGSYETVEIYYEIAYIEGENDIYQVLCWTAPSRKTSAEKEMKAMISSFTEVKNKTAKKRLSN